MPRGRKRIPDAVLALKGGRRHHRQPEAGAAPTTAPVPRPLPTFEVPDWLTSKRARSIFRKVVGDYLQRRIIRAPDFIVAGRWATYLDRWIEIRNGPLTPLVELERVMRPLEDRLGLSPAARQEIVKAMAAMPAAIGDMLAEESQSGARTPVGEAADVATAGDQPSSAAPPAVSPLGFLRLVE